MLHFAKAVPNLTVVWKNLELKGGRGKSEAMSFVEADVFLAIYLILARLGV